MANNRTAHIDIAFFSFCFPGCTTTPSSTLRASSPTTWPSAWAPSSASLTRLPVCDWDEVSLICIGSCYRYMSLGHSTFAFRWTTLHSSWRSMSSMLGVLSPVSFFSLLFTCHLTPSLSYVQVPHPYHIFLCMSLVYIFLYMQVSRLVSDPHSTSKRHSFIPSIACTNALWTLRLYPLKARLCAARTFHSPTPTIFPFLPQVTLWWTAALSSLATLRSTAPLIFSTLFPASSS